MFLTYNQLWQKLNNNSDFYQTILRELYTPCNEVKGCIGIRLSVCHTFVRKISFKPLNCMQPNLAWWCIIMTWSVLRKGWVPTFKVSQCGLRSSKNNCLPYLLIFWTFCNQMWYIVMHHHEPEWCVTIFWFAVPKVKYFPVLIVSQLSIRSYWGWLFLLVCSFFLCLVFFRGRDHSHWSDLSFCHLQHVHFY